MEEPKDILELLKSSDAFKFSPFNPDKVKIQ